MDEITVTLDPPLRACRMKVEQQKRIPATQPGEKQKRLILGGYDWLEDTITWTTAKTKNSPAFIDFVEDLLIHQYPTDRVILVLDNASYYKSGSALAALSLFEHRVITFWLHHKNVACANKLQDDIDEVAKSAEKLMTIQNDPSANFRFHVS